MKALTCRTLAAHQYKGITLTVAPLDDGIDIRDYVNGIGNRSHEPYIRARTLL